jgi:thiamine pyrophosphate-dependent acetolactate synthase large subunit-like protein
VGGEVSAGKKDARLDRRAAVKALLADRERLLVVTGLGSPSYDVFAAGDSDANFYLWGAMGGAALVGLGLAVAQPERPVAAFTGDGEQLMGLGGLATIAVTAPRNLSVVVLDNGHFGETGGQLSHSGRGVDLVRVAQAMGFPVVLDVDSEAHYAAARAALANMASGPKFIAVRIANGEKPRMLPPRDGAFLKTRFRAHLGFAVR